MNWGNVEWKNLPKVLTMQHRIRTRVLVVESPKLYPWAIALYNGMTIVYLACVSLVCSASFSATWARCLSLMSINSFSTSIHFLCSICSLRMYCSSSDNDTLVACYTLTRTNLPFQNRADSIPNHVSLTIKKGNFHIKLSSFYFRYNGNYTSPRWHFSTLSGSFFHLKRYTV